MRKTTVFVVLLLLCCCNGKKDIESMAKKQAEKTMREFARNPESIVVSDMEVVFKTDSVCVLHFVQRGQNGFGGYSRGNIEYMYCIQFSGDIYECVIDLEDKGSKYEDFKEMGMESALRSKGKLGPDDVTNWIKGSIGMYTWLHGRQIEK